MATIIIITPPPTRPNRPQNEPPRVSVLNIDVIEVATEIEILHAALSTLDNQDEEQPGPGNPTNPTE